MGRSVNYHSDSYAVIYTHIPDNEVEIIWDEYKNDILNTFQQIAPSLCECKPKWHNNEVCQFAENSLVTVWLSDYCGLISISFVPKEEGYCTGKYIEGLAKHWIDQVIPKLRKSLVPNVLNKIGTFSNGESIYEKLLFKQ